MIIKLWLLTAHGDENNTGPLWWKETETGQAPTPGQDEIVLWEDEEGDPSGGPQWPVRRRYWDANGQIHCELSRMVIDPDTSLPYDRNQPPYSRPWYTAVDGPPQVGLTRGSWSRYQA